MKKNNITLLITALLIGVSCRSAPPKIAADKPVAEWHWSYQPMYGKHANSPKLTEKQQSVLRAYGVPEKMSKNELSEKHVWLAWDEFHAGKNEDAIVSFNLAWWLNPKDHRPYWGMAMVLERYGHYEEAKPLFGKAFEMRPNDSELYYARGWLLLGRKGAPQMPQILNEALQLCDQSIALNPNDDRAHVARATALYYLGRVSEAKEAAELAINCPQCKFPHEASKKIAADLLQLINRRPLK